MTAQPHNLEAERSALGSMLYEREALRWGAEFLAEEDFYLPMHRQLFGILSGMAEKNTPASMAAVLEGIERSGLDLTGEQLAELMEWAAGLSGMSHYASMLKDQTLRRKMIAQAMATMGQLQATKQETAAELLERIQTEWAALETDELRDALRPLKEILADTYESLEQQAQEVAAARFNTGLRSFDNLTGGLQQGAFYVIGARPRMGKTTLAVNWLSHLAFREKVPVALFSMEMKGTAIGQKIMASEGRVNAFSLRMARLEERDWSALQITANKAYDAPLYVDDRRGQTVAQIVTTAKRAARQYGVRCVAIDYFQLLRLGGKAESARLAYVECSHALQALAGDANITVLLLSQLARSAEMRADRRPALEDLKETGALEEDADVVTLIYHPQGKPSAGAVELIVAKNRLGESEKTAHAYWNPELQQFRDLRAGEEYTKPTPEPSQRGPYEN